MCSRSLPALSVIDRLTLFFKYALKRRVSPAAHYIFDYSRYAIYQYSPIVRTQMNRPAQHFICNIHRIRGCGNCQKKH